MGVSCVAIHPNYGIDFFGLYSDVAVLKLSASATTATFVTLNSDTSYPSTGGQALTAIGFGLTSGGGTLSSTLRKAGVNFVTTANCQNNWECVRQQFHVCASQGTNVGVCQGKLVQEVHQNG